VTIHRTSLAEDGFRQLNSWGPALKQHMQITFIDKYLQCTAESVYWLTRSRFDQEEVGIDGGGLFKEFFTRWVGFSSSDSWF